MLSIGWIVLAAGVIGLIYTLYLGLKSRTTGYSEINESHTTRHLQINENRTPRYSESYGPEVN
jgi:hypothetical protein